MERKTRNWRRYNRNLINRGNITLWISKNAVKKWLASKDKNHFGRPFKYSDGAIICAWTLRFTFHLTLRALQGFLESLRDRGFLPDFIPSYSQICRRGQKLHLASKISKKRPTDIVFDSTGLKVYGDGEWKVKMHGKSKRRKWRKIHIAICPETQEILLQELTEGHCNDSKLLPSLVRKLPSSVRRIYGDGIYDTGRCYRAIYEKGAEAIIPVRRGARYRDSEKSPWLKDRNQQILQKRGLGGDEEADKIWKKLKNYHKRSLVETAMYRLKTLLGASLKSRKLSAQKVEVMIKCLILNRTINLEKRAKVAA